MIYRATLRRLRRLCPPPRPSVIAFFVLRDDNGNPTMISTANHPTWSAEDGPLPDWYLAHHPAHAKPEPDPSI